MQWKHTPFARYKQLTLQALTLKFQLYQSQLDISNRPKVQNPPEIYHHSYNTKSLLKAT